MAFTTQICVFLGILVSVLSQESEEPNLITVAVGAEVDLPLNVTLGEGESFISLSWKHGDEDVAIWGGQMELYTKNYVGRVAIAKDNYHLKLQSATLDDSGKYRGTLLSSKGSVVERSILKVLASPAVSAKPVQVVDDKIDDVKVVAECEAIGGSAPYTMEWYEDDKLLAGDDEKIPEENSENANLEDAVLALSLEPRAEYNGKTVKCVVTDALQEKIVKEVQLQITEPTTTVPTTTMQAYPEIVRFTRPNNTPFIVGSKRTLNCQATGVPEPVVTWYKDDKTKLASGTGESKIVVVARSYSDSGVYKCEASNQEGRVTKKTTLEVQAAPVIPGIESLPNRTEKVVVKPDEKFVLLTCESESTPRPEITWSIAGMDLDKMEFDINEVKSRDGFISNISISARHFREAEKETKVTCIAANFIGQAKKHFLVTVPIKATNAGLIAGVVVALIILLVIIALVAYIALTRKRQGSMKTSSSPESGVCAGWSTCCGAPVVKSKELKEEEDAVAVEHVKEVSEDGTNEEKQKLTEAEASPAKEDDKTEDKEGEKAEEKEEGEGEKPKKTKVPLPMQCCRGRKKKSTDKGDQKEEQVEEENQGKETGNGDTKKEGQGEEEKKEKQQTDRDSGKGDTLEKVIEEKEK